MSPLHAEMIDIAPHPASEPATASAEAGGVVYEFGEVYCAHFKQVVRWLRALGICERELEDTAQEIFIVVQRKLPGFHGASLKGWLFRIASRTARDHRRASWFRRVLLGDDSHAEPASCASGAEGRVEAQDLVWRVMGTLSEKRRVAFVLYEIEGFDGPEIANLLDVPVGTVWTRIHHARRDFQKGLALLETKRERG